MESALDGIPALTVADKKAEKLRNGLLLRGLQTEYDEGTTLIVKEYYALNWLCHGGW